ncbi:MAG: hypothetical protein ABFC63_07465 [Thermoguttaceae bacterium]
MHSLIVLTLVALAGGQPTQQNPVFKELLDRGIAVSDGTSLRLPPPILADGLDAAAQRAALDRAADARSSAADLLRKSSFAPVVVKIRTVKRPKGEGPAVRAIDVWFVAHGDWKVLNSKQFLESALKSSEGSKSQMVSKSGVLDDKELAARKLAPTVKPNYEERFLYATISLFDHVQLSMTRRAVMTKTDESVLAAGRIDPRFATDPNFPNQWRSLDRDAQANIKLGAAHPFAHAGGYAKITRLKSPANASLVECHMIYEEDYGWFEGVNLVKQKVPAIVQDRVRSFRRKLTLASQNTGDKQN